MRRFQATILIQVGVEILSLRGTFTFHESTHVSAIYHLPFARFLRKIGASYKDSAISIRRNNSRPLPAVVVAVSIFSPENQFLIRDTELSLFYDHIFLDCEVLIYNIIIHIEYILNLVNFMRNFQSALIFKLNIKLFYE